MGGKETDNSRQSGGKWAGELRCWRAHRLTDSLLSLISNGMRPLRRRKFFSHEINLPLESGGRQSYVRSHLLWENKKWEKRSWSSSHGGRMDHSAGNDALTAPFRQSDFVWELNTPHGVQSKWPLFPFSDLGCCDVLHLFLLLLIWMTETTSSRDKMNWLPKPDVCASSCLASQWLNELFLSSPKCVRLPSCEPLPN